LLVGGVVGVLAPRELRVLGPDVVHRLGERLDGERGVLLVADAGDAEAADGAVRARIERDDGEILERGVVAQPRRGEELVQDRLLGRSGARGEHESGERSAEQATGAIGLHDALQSILNSKSSNPQIINPQIPPRAYPPSSSSRSTSLAIDTTLSSPSMSISFTPCVARPIARTSSVCIRRIMPCWVMSSSSSPSCPYPPPP